MGEVQSSHMLRVQPDEGVGDLGHPDLMTQIWEDFGSGNEDDMIDMQMHNLFDRNSPHLFWHPEPTTSSVTTTTTTHPIGTYEQLMTEQYREMMHKDIIRDMGEMRFTPETMSVFEQHHLNHENINMKGVNESDSETMMKLVE